MSGFDHANDPASVASALEEQGLGPIVGVGAFLIELEDLVIVFNENAGGRTDHPSLGMFTIELLERMFQSSRRSKPALIYGAGSQRPSAGLREFLIEYLQGTRCAASLAELAGLVAELRNDVHHLARFVRRSGIGGFSPVLEGFGSDALLLAPYARLFMYRPGEDAIEDLVRTAQRLDPAGRDFPRSLLPERDSSAPSIVYGWGPSAPPSDLVEGLDLQTHRLLAGGDRVSVARTPGELISTLRELVARAQGHGSARTVGPQASFRTVVPASREPEGAVHKAPAPAASVPSGRRI